MKIVCSKSDLVKAVFTVSKAVPTRTTMPILECIILDATAGDIRLMASDTELAIETTIDGEILEPGVIGLNARLFGDMVRKLPDLDVTISCGDNLVTNIRCGKAIFDIAGQNADDFNFLPANRMFDPVVISELALKDVIRQTIFSTADNDNNRMMTGEHFLVRDSALKVTSLDGHRISIRQVDLKERYEETSVIVPGKVLNEITKILSGGAEDMVSIFFSKNEIIFEFENTVVVSRLIDGEYFKVDQMISADFSTKVSVSKRDLLDCIDRSTLFVKEGEKKPIIMQISEGSMRISIRSALGALDEDLAIEKEGGDLTIGFNPKFFMDALRAIDDEQVDIYYVNQKAPCVIKDAEGSYLYLILPVNIIV